MRLQKKQCQVLFIVIIILRLLNSVLDLFQRIQTGNKLTIENIQLKKIMVENLPKIVLKTKIMVETTF